MPIMAGASPQTAPDWARHGDHVTWPGPDGHTLSGVVQQYNAAIGKLIVRTDEGLKAVPLAALDPPEPDGGAGAV
jgi:hypothetical protein